MELDRNVGQQYIYVLKLSFSEHIYYVGKTTDVARRFEEHCSGKGSAWTKYYFDKGKGREFELFEFFPEKHPFDEDHKTEQLMEEHGIGNVRGGTYSQIVLSDEKVKDFNVKCRGATNRCLRCNSANHMVALCPIPPPAKRFDQGELPRNRPSSEELRSREFEPQKRPRYSDDLPTHTARASSFPIDAMIFRNSAKHSSATTNHPIPPATNQFKRKISSTSSFKSKSNRKSRKGLRFTHMRGACFRCGRSSHIVPECYAGTDINGDPLSECDSEDDY